MGVAVSREASDRMPALSASPKTTTAIHRMVGPHSERARNTRRAPRRKRWQLLAGQCDGAGFDRLRAAAGQKFTSHGDVLPGHGLEAVIGVGIVVIERHEV